MSIVSSSADFLRSPELSPSSSSLTLSTQDASEDLHSNPSPSLSQSNQGITLSQSSRPLHGIQATTTIPSTFMQSSMSTSNPRDGYAQAPFKFDRFASTIPEIWEECQRYNMYKKQNRCLGYRNSSYSEYSTEKRYITNRLVVAKEIEYIKATQNVSVDEAISQLESERCTLQKSLAKFMDIKQSFQRKCTQERLQFLIVGRLAAFIEDLMAKTSFLRSKTLVAMTSMNNILVGLLLLQQVYGEKKSSDFDWN
ncbi:hypothetical protein BGZ79_009008 [Entomortierella chlamydospora]|nr:hypothetical protein BGZ79_009008 [Entomortierella chlamydospora]